MSVWDVRDMMDILDLHRLKASINHDVTTDDAGATGHHCVVVGNTDAVWRMWDELVQEL